MRNMNDLAKRPTKEEFEKIDEKNVIFITHPGRMGDEDGSTFIIKKDNNYIAYRVSGWMYGTNESISYQEFLKHFPLFEQSCHGKIDDVYDEIQMGFGNRLYVKKEIFPEYKKYLESAKEEYLTTHEDNNYDAGIIFNVWDKALINMANDKNIIINNLEKNENTGQKHIYLYIEYVDSIGDRLYCYRTDDDSIIVGDYVLVDRAGNEITGKVINKKYYKEDEVPYPLDKTKFIISKTNNLSYEVDDDKGFRFIGYKILKINNFTTIGLDIKNDYNEVDSKEDNNWWCYIDLYVENDYFKYKLTGENITTSEIDYVKDIIDRCINDKINEDEEFETLEPYFTFIARANNDYNPKFEIRLYYEIDGCFARNEFYSLGIDDKDELKALYDMLNY